MNEAITKAIKGGQKVLQMAGMSPSKKQAKLLVFQDQAREVRQEFEVFY